MTAYARPYWNRPPFKSASLSGTADPVLARWAIVLAGGEGARMRPLINDWLGEARPKQYCTFVGSRSMFQHTIDRARSVVPEEHIVTIIGRGHRKFMTQAENEHMPGVVLEQMNNLGTAPGVFLPTAYVLAKDPEATVLILPSDHFVHPEEKFRETIAQSLTLAEKYRERLIRLGAIPDRAETDYGWIAPDKTQTDWPGPPAHEPLQVMNFQEKPGEREASALLRQGCLWNTMVMAVKARTLWALGRQCLPEMMGRFDRFLTVLRSIRKGRLGPDFESTALATVYNDLSPADFSRDILQRASERSMVLPMVGVAWSDWGRPQRLSETLVHLGCRSLLPPRFLESVQESATSAREVR